MCSSRLVWLYVVVAMLCCGVRLAAQDVEYDYRQYKYYDEPAGDVELLLRTLARDTITHAVGGYEPSATPRYALEALGYKARGVGREEESYGVGALALEYDAARMLGALGGLRATHLNGVAPRREVNTLRGELSTKNYNVGVSHRATYRMPTGGVMLDDGWVLSHYVRLRTGRDAVVEGLFSSGAEVALGASYEGGRHTLAVAVMLPWSERGLRESSVEEAYRLTGDVYYNPCWGMQAGRVRNSRVATSLHPEVVAQWRYRVSLITTLHVAADVGYRSGGSTSLAWFDAPTPMPDNYRYMPSFYDDDSQARAITEAWVYDDVRYTQIDWDDLYHTNALQMDGRARYAVERRMEHDMHGRVVAGMESRLGALDVGYGLTFAMMTERSFKVMDDLLGADHIVDHDYFLRDDATYSTLLDNNLLEPNRVVHQGDRFGYDYRLSRASAVLYGTLHWADASMAVDVDARLGAETTWRRGYYEKEIFAGSKSLGRSPYIWRTPYHLSASWRYTLPGHDVAVAVMLRGQSPECYDDFLQVQYNNRTTGRACLATTLAAEAMYSFEYERLRLSAKVYMLSYNNLTDVLHYYDDLAGVYVDAVVSNIDRLHYGLEAVVDVTWQRYLTSCVALNIGRYGYVSDAIVESYDDRSNDLLTSSLSAVRGLVTGAPQLTAYGDVAFKMSGWQVTLSAQCRALAHLAPSFARRTARVLSYAAAEEDVEALMRQLRLRDGLCVNLYVAKGIRLKGGVYMRLHVAGYNLLGGAIVYSGYEQNRVRRSSVAGRSYVEPFAGEVMYGAQRSLQLGASIWF